MIFKHLRFGGTVAVACFALLGMPVISEATLTITAGDFNAPDRTNWINASSNPTGMVVENLDSLSGSTVLLPTSNVTSGTSAPYIPSGNPLDVDLGQLNGRFYKYNASGSAFGWAVQTASTFSGSTGIGGSGSTSGKWGWVQFRPKTGSWSDFAVDFNTTYTNERSGVGYFSWRVYFDDGSNRLGRFETTAGSGTDRTNYVDYLTRAAGTGFIGFRESNANISAVEFFQFSNGSGLYFDNPTFLAAAPVPEPSTLACGASGLVGFLLVARSVRRRRA